MFNNSEGGSFRLPTVMKAVSQFPKVNEAAYQLSTVKEAVNVDKRQKGPEIHNVDGA